MEVPVVEPGFTVLYREGDHVVMARPTREVLANPAFVSMLVAQLRAETHPAP